MSDNGWQPLSKPKRSEGSAAFHVSPFTRLARTHVAAAAGDALFVIALAGSLFFDVNLEADDARTQVALYLALTMAPFAVVAPLIGPALDRMKGGRRFMVIGSNALRALLCVMLIRDFDSMLLFPEAFAVLVLQKSYHVAKSAIVPTVVRSDAELVEANSRLSLLSSVAGIVAAPAAGLAIFVGGSQGVLLLAAAVFTAGAVLGVKVPATKISADHTSETEREELRGGGILLAASAMALMRGLVGFLAFLVAFDLRTKDEALWQYGVVVALATVGAGLGSLLAPVLRRSMAEERMLQSALGAMAVTGILAAWQGGLVAAAALALCVGLAAQCGKLAFDAVVQRDAPDANRGRSFARFETRFQLTWVVGAFLPVAIPLLPAIDAIPQSLGFLVIAACAVFALVTYLIGLKALARGEVPVQRNRTKAIATRLLRKRQGFAVEPTPAPEPRASDGPDAAADTGPDRSAAADPGSAGSRGAPDRVADGTAGNLPALPDQASDEPAAPPAPPEVDDADPPTHARDRIVIDPTNL
jgi:hypothetical protein